MTRGEKTSLRDRRDARDGLATRLGSSEGAQLLEFALVLPMLLLLLLGTIDFGAAFTLKHKLNNAAREGVRFTIAEAPGGVSNWPAVPPTTKAILSDILDYLTKTSVDVCGLTSTSGASSTPSYGDWVFSAPCSDTGGQISIEINRGVSFTNGSGVTVAANTITISRPYKWNLLVGSVLGATNQITTLTSDATMEQ